MNTFGRMGDLLMVGEALRERGNYMVWKRVRSQEDVDCMNETFGEFHDCCLKEVSFSTGGYVSEDLSMNVIGFPTARFLFQRQMRNPSVIEIEFRDIIQINIKPVEKNQGVDIIGAHLYLQDDIFFWSEKDYEFHDGNKDTYTWIAARFTQWRERDDLLGSQMVYMPD